MYAQQLPSRIEKKNFSDIKEIQFDHIYGNITVTESASKQIELEIQYFDNNEIKPACEISTTNNMLEIKTDALILRNRRNRNREKIGIDYIIVVPENVAMKVNLKYGNMNMDDFHGNFKGDFTYGNLNAGTFFSSPVDISGKYANIEIEELDVLNLSITYGNVNVTEINTFKVRSKYSNYKIGNVKTVNAACEYGNINIESVVEFDAELRYTPMNIDNLGEKLKLKCSYSGIKIKKCSKDLKKIDFYGAYSNFGLGLDANLSARFDVNLRFGNLSISEKYNVEFSFSEKNYNTLIKKGVIGAKTPTADITISNSFAGVSIK
jgi:hypothetical protein